MAHTIVPNVDPGDDILAAWGDAVRAADVDLTDRVEDLEAAGVGSGDVVGPPSLVDNEIPRSNGTTGKLLQGSGIVIPDGASGSVNGVNTGDQTIALTGDVTGSGTGSFAATIANDAVTYAKLQNISAAARLLGRGSAAGAGNAEEILLGSGVELVGNTLNATGAAGSGAPATATYVTLATDATLTNERVLAAGTGIALVDNGAGGTIEIHATPTTGAQNTYLVTGGQIVWQSAYTFDVSAASYFINGSLYTSAADTVTLALADPTDDRIDVIAVDDSGAVVVIAGTAASQPVEPDVDPGTQLKLGFVLVTAASSAPAVTDELLYAENVGSGSGEWDWTTSGSGFTLGSTNNPRGGTKDIEGTAVTNGSYVQGEIGAGTLVATDYTLLAVYLRSKATWANNRGLSVSLRLNGAIVGTAVTIQRSGTWGFASSSTAGYQLVAIPITAFAIPSGSPINQIRIADFGGSIGFYLDDISLQGGATTPTPVTGITQDQADARYVRRPGSAADNALGRFNGTDGTTIQGGAATLEDDGRIANLTDPSGAQDAATKSYVDGIAINLGKRARVRAATTANVTIATALNSADVLDGVTLATGDLVLVKDQSSAAENGVYTVGVSPARATEFDTYNEHPGSLIAVQEGTANADTLWLCTSNVGGTLNSTALAFTGLSVGAAITQLTGDVTAGPGSGSQAATIANDAVTNAKSANMAQATLKGRAAGAGTGDPTDLTTTQATAILDVMVGDSGSGGTKGLVPAPAAGDAAAGKFLKADGTYAAPSGSGAPSSAQYVTLATDGSLSAERVLTGTSNQIAITDGGANGAVTLSTPQNIHTGATPQFARMGLAAAADADAKLLIAGQYGSTTVAAGNSSTAKTLDWNDGNTQLLTLTGACTLTLSNPKDGFRYLIALKQDGTGSRTVTWPSAVKWPAGTAPTLSTTAGKTDIVTLVWVAGIGASGNYLAAANTDYTPA